MQAVVFLGSGKSGSSYEAIRAADELGFYTILLTNNPSFIHKRSDFLHAHSVRLCDLDDAGETGAAVGLLMKEGFDIRAVVSFIDPYCHTAALLSREYGLKCFSEKAIAAMQDKVKSRETVARTPHSLFYRVINDPVIPPAVAREMPLVLKAPRSTGSKDVHLVWTARQYERAFSLLRARVPSAPLIAEKYIPEPQYLVETLTTGGHVNIAAVIRQEITFTGRFIVTGYRMMLDDKGDLFRSLKAASETILAAYGMTDGPCHLELRKHGGQWRLIEANPRIAGGAMNALIQTATGVDLVKETLRLALGERPDLEQKHKKETFCQYIVLPKGGVLSKVTGKRAAQNSPGVEHVYIKPRKGSLLVPPSSMGHRYAFVIAAGRSAAEARKNAKRGAGHIKFYLRAGEAENALSEEAGQNRPRSHTLDTFLENVVFEAL